MKKRKLLFILILCLITIQDGNAESEPEDSSQTQINETDGEKKAGKEKSSSEQNPDLTKPPDFKQFLRDTAERYAIMWAARFFFVREKDERIFDASASQFFDNFTEAPEWDDGDGFVKNFVWDPLLGSVYYLAYRAKGHSVMMSAVGTVVMSTLLQYTVEGLVGRPSGHDLIFMPAIGVPVGIGLENASEWLMKKDNRVATVAAYILNPTKLVYKDRDLGVINPVTGVFQFHGPFTMNQSKAKAIKLGYPLFFESPLPLGGFTGSFEVVSLDDEFDNGQFILYSMRLDFPNSNGTYSIYLEIPYGGINNVEVNGEEIEDGFEFGNVRIGGKFLLIESEDLILAGGLEVAAPTAMNDNKDRLETITKVGKDLPLYLPDSATLTPYASAAIMRGPFSLQGNIGIDSILSASEVEGDSLEVRLKYSSAVGVSLPVPLTPQLFVELNGYTTPTASDTQKTDIFVTPGIKFGKKFGSGIGVQIPVTGSSADLIKASFVFDFQLRF